MQGPVEKRLIRGKKNFATSSERDKVNRATDKEGAHFPKAQRGGPDRGGASI